MGSFNMQEPVFDVHPEGVFVGELVDFTDEGYKEGQYGTYRSAFFDISTGQLTEDGEVFFPMRFYVNENAGERSKTTLFREAVAGRKLTRPERLDFDPERILGRKVQVQVKHNERDGKKYANIDAVMALPQGAQQQQAAPQPQAQAAKDVPHDDDDLPFG